MHNHLAAPQMKNLSSTIVLLAKFLFIKYSWYILNKSLAQTQVKNIAW